MSAGSAGGVPPAVQEGCCRRHVLLSPLSAINEGDEPAFTQPLMYKAIAGHKSVRTNLRRKAGGRGRRHHKRKAAQQDKDFQAFLESEFEVSKNYKPNKADWLEGAWAGLTPASDEYTRGDNRRDSRTVCRPSAKALVHVPEGFVLNPKIARQLKAKGAGADDRRRHRLGDGRGAGRSARLLIEGVPVRLLRPGFPGRGHVQASATRVLYDQDDESRHIPLTSIASRQANFLRFMTALCRKPRFLGFEYGYTLAETPTRWCYGEAQFGGPSPTARR